MRLARRAGVERSSYRPPSLPNVAGRAPYMHAGQFSTLAGVVDHYNRAPNALTWHNELNTLNLSGREKAQLVAFLKTLSSPPAGDPAWLAPPGE